MDNGIHLTTFYFDGAYNKHNCICGIYQRNLDSSENVASKSSGLNLTQGKTWILNLLKNFVNTSETTTSWITGYFLGKYPFGVDYLKKGNTKNTNNVVAEFLNQTTEQNMFKSKLIESIKIDSLTFQIIKLHYRFT